MYTRPPSRKTGASTTTGDPADASHGPSADGLSPEMFCAFVAGIRTMVALRPGEYTSSSASAVPLPAVIFR